MGSGANAGIGIGSVLLAALLAAAPAAAEEPLSVAYGRGARTAEGDVEFRESVYLRVPAATTDRLYLRVFDADVGGARDTRYGAGWNTRMRYTLYGGAGAARPQAPPDTPAAAGEANIGGTPLAEAEIGEDASADDAWRTLASFRPDQGDLVDGRYVFRLEVAGGTGDDGNAFAATLSARDRRNVPPSGLEVLDYAPSVRIPDGRRLTELAFDVPAGTERVTVHNFDAASGRVAFAGPFRTVELPASGQDRWQAADIVLLPDEKGARASIIVAGGTEIPNDLTLFVTDAAGRSLPLLLPAKSWRPNGRPQPAAALTPLADCPAQAFDASRTIDPDGDPLAYRWEFGDGSGAEGTNVVHRYEKPGTYQALLRVTDGSGQVGSGAALPLRVTVKRPPVADAGDDAVAAPGEPISFDGTGSTPGDRPIARYAWDFQDGGTQATGPRAAHAFARPGRYRVTLRVQDDQPGACDGSADQVTVDVNAAPVAVAGPDRRVAVGDAVELDGGRSYDPDGRVAAWSWDFGDGARAEGASATHRYEQPGTYTATLTVRDGAGLANSTAAATARVLVNDPPVASAGPDRKVAVGEVIRFDGGGSLDRDGQLVRHAWRFGDGNEGTGATVPYAYGQPGVYEATLAVTDDSGSASDTATDAATITVNAPPVARAGANRVVTASEVRFDGSASRDPDGEIIRYAWDFGDGTAGEGVQPAHVYRQAGSYDVTLTVTDDAGTPRNSDASTLRVLVNQAPIADAGPDQLGSPGQEFVFAGSGSFDPDGDLTDYLWDFKDGTTASGERVTHRFARPGVYQVRLTVRDDTGQPEAVDFDDAEVVVNAPPVANAGADRLAAPGEAVRFDALNSSDPDGSIASFRWDFSDIPEPAVGREVTRTYEAPGIYSARLTVTDSSGTVNGVAQDQVTVRVNHAPVANAGADVFTAASTVAFDGAASADADGDALVYSWDFGDGSPPAGGVRAVHTYPAGGGTYPVVLTVDDGTGQRNARAVAAVTVTIDGPPAADAGGNREVCAGDVVVLDGSRSRDPEGGLLRYRWDFGDGSGAEIVNPTKTYNRGGTYPVTLTVEDDSGFSTNRHTDRALVRVTESPIAVAGPDQMACASTEVRFDGSASRDADGVVNRFAWDFGDGTTGGGDRPVHIFNKPGDYRVALTITGDQVGQCANTNLSELTVRVVEAPVPRIVAPSSVAVGESATFDASASTVASGRIVGWDWEFGDGGSGEGSTVRHAFATAGPHLVTLTLRTEGGVSTCSAVKAQHAITANASPVAAAGPDRVVAEGEEILFDAAGSRDEDGGIARYGWEFGDGTTATGINARHAYERSGRYEVRLTVEDGAGLANSSTTDSAVVVVNHPPQPVIAAPAATCPLESVALGAGASRDPDGTITGFAWSFGDGQAAPGQDVSHVYQAPGVYDLVLVADDGAGVANSKEQSVRRLQVNRQPRAEAGPDRLVCPDQEVVFDASSSVDWDNRLVGFRWDFGDGTQADGIRAAHRFTRPGSFRVGLTVTDDSGTSCATDTATARITVNTPPRAVAGGDREGFVGGAHDGLLFDGSASRDADGNPLSFLWDLGDGVVLAGDKVRHGYARAGRYPVRLTVSDGSGLDCGQVSETVEVAVRPRKE